MENEGKKMSIDNKHMAQPFIFLMGVIIGGVIATLFAPKKGKELRKDVKNRSRQVQKSLNNAKNETKESFKREFQNLKKTGGDENGQSRTGSLNSEQQ